MKDYLKNLNTTEIFPDLVDYARDNNVPIINYEALLLIKSYLRVLKPERILEIGSAIGYSALHFASVDLNIKVDTIERDAKMYDEINKNLVKHDLKQQITVYHEDALTLDLNKLAPSYDLIFIDAGKAQYQKFFMKYEPKLRIGGLIVTDNILFHSLVGHNDLVISTNLRNLTKKINDYNQWLKTLINYQTTYLALGDGLAISHKVRV